MKINKDVQDYIHQIPADRKDAFQQLLETIRTNIPDGFLETISYGMIGWVVPKSIYPAGYHCDTKLPLPFLNLANQKNFIALYHMGVYADKDLYEWFTTAYPQHAKFKLDMGKSCIRFKRMDDIPYELIGELVSKISVQDWIEIYESNMTKK